MRVRVERIRRGQRTAEVEYVEAKTPRRRRVASQEEGGAFAANPWADSHEKAAASLRLPWKINSRRG